MAEKICAVLIDQISIQKYIFASNQLKDNLGASHILKHLYDIPVERSLMEALDAEETQVHEWMKAWENHPENIRIQQDPDVQFEVGIVGGGNALFFFRDYDLAVKFVKLFTSRLLIEAPGVRPGVAVTRDFDMESFPGSLRALFGELAVNRSRYAMVTTLPSHGVTASCPYTGCTLDLPYESIETKHISAVSYAKKKAAEREEQEMATCLENGGSAWSKDYTLTDHLSKLGQRDGESHIAVVHIDGNNMGDWFKSSSSLKQYRQRSLGISQVSSSSLKYMMERTVQLMPELQAKASGFHIDSKDGRWFLPVRPIILGGDDVTFVCDARLGLYLCEVFIREWRSKANQELNHLGFPAGPDGSSLPFSACAGLCIVKTKYPFYRAYALAEELCGLAKQAARKKPGTSWVDFHIQLGGMSGSLENMRDREWTARQINLNFGPYLVEQDQAPITDIQDIALLKNGINQFHNREVWSRTKVKGLRTAINAGCISLQQFIMNQKAQGIALPSQDGGVYPDKFAETGLIYSAERGPARTPYYEMLEMSEFYPPFLLKGAESC